MIQIQKGAANRIILSLSETTTFPNATYLFEFIHSQTRDSHTCIAADTSAFPTRYNQFEITETTSPNGLLAQVELEIEGFYTYKIYAQLAETNLTPANADELVETGFAYIIGTDETTHTYTPSTNNGFVYNG